MLVKYKIHKVGTPRICLKNHWTEFESEYWNNEDGWGHPSTSDIYDSKEYSLPLDGEWVEIYVEELV